MNFLTLADFVICGGAVWQNTFLWASIFVKATKLTCSLSLMITLGFCFYFSQQNTWNTIWVVRLNFIFRHKIWMRFHDRCRHASQHSHLLALFFFSTGGIWARIPRSGHNWNDKSCWEERINARRKYLSNSKQFIVYLGNSLLYFWKIRFTFDSL